MKFQVLKPEEYLEMPWKNGKGVTRQIAKEVDGASTFLWRLSSARISEAGPFSNYPGFDRFLCVIGSETLSLRRESGETQVLHPKEVLFFAGEEQIENLKPCVPLSDFNLIFDRTQIQASFAIHQVSAEFCAFENLGSETFIYVLSGAIQTDLGCELSADSTLRICSATSGSLRVKSLSGTSDLVLIKIHMHKKMELLPISVAE